MALLNGITIFSHCATAYGILAGMDVEPHLVVMLGRGKGDQSKYKTKKYYYCTQIHTMLWLTINERSIFLISSDSGIV